MKHKVKPWDKKQGWQNATKNTREKNKLEKRAVAVMVAGYEFSEGDPEFWRGYKWRWKLDETVSRVVYKSRADAINAAYYHMTNPAVEEEVLQFWG